MSANNIVFIRKYKKKYQVWYQGCVDNDGLGELKKEFEKLEDALKYAEKLCNEYWVEYGIRFINFLKNI